MVTDLQGRRLFDMRNKHKYLYQAADAAGISSKTASKYLKNGKLPFKTESITYDLEYGTDTLEVHNEAVRKGAKVLMVDDLLATGGTMAAACKLVEKIGGQITGVAFLIELIELAGREKLTAYNVKTVISY